MLFLDVSGWVSIWIGGLKADYTSPQTPLIWVGIIQSTESLDRTKAAGKQICPFFQASLLELLRCLISSSTPGLGFTPSAHFSGFGTLTELHLWLSWVQFADCRLWDLSASIILWTNSSNKSLSVTHTHTHTHTYTRICVSIYAIGSIYLENLE